MKTVKKLNTMNMKGCVCAVLLCLFFLLFFSNMCEVNIATINVNGLREIKKELKCLKWLNKKS